MEGAKPTEPSALSLETPSNMMICISTDQHHIHQLPKPVVRLDFMCNYCHRKFHSAQALGGHQNAHRHERQREHKHEHERATVVAQSRHQSRGEAAMGAFTHSNVQHRHHGYRPPISSSLLGLLGSLNNSNNKSVIDIQLVHSMIHKPALLSSLSSSSSSSSYSSPCSHLYGHDHGWSSTTPMDHHRRLGRLFDGGLVVGAPLPCGTKLVNIGGRTDGGIDTRLGGGRGCLKTNEEDLQELDLSLKL